MEREMNMIDKRNEKF